MTAAQAAVVSAEAAYQVAQKKYAVNRTDQVAVSCFNLDNVKQTYDDAVNAYNALRDELARAGQWHRWNSLRKKRTSIGRKRLTIKP